MCGGGCQKSKGLLVLLLIHLGYVDFVLISYVGIPLAALPVATPMMEVESVSLSLYKRAKMGCKKREKHTCCSKLETWLGLRLT